MADAALFMRRAEGERFQRFTMLPGATEGSFELMLLNLAEGAGRFSRADQQRIYGIALGSLRECEAVFAIIGVSDPALLELQNKLGAFIFRLCRPRA